MVSPRSQSVYMVRSLRILFLATFVLVASQAAFSKTPEKIAKAKKIFELQSEINGYRASAKMVNSMAKFAEKDPSKKLLKDSAVAAQIKSDIEEAYINEMITSLTDKELDYLISLYSSQMFRKYINLERSFWNNKSNQIVNEKLSLYQKSPLKK